MACDFLIVETVFLKTLFVLFFIELGTRRVRIAGVTANPDARWVTQQGRNLAMAGGLSDIRFLIRDLRDEGSGSREHDAPPSWHASHAGSSADLSA